MPPRQRPEQAEPRSIGTSGTANILAREVRLLGALLGEIIVEQAGREVFELVESTRLRAIAARRSDGDERVTFDVLPVEAEVLEGVVRAFGLYFRLINLAEARERLRQARRRARATGGASEGARLRSILGRLGDASDLQRIRISPVLTAHPTEARRRTVLVALRRIARLLERLDDPRLAPSGDRDVRRRLREEIAVLWQTAELRRGAPSPIDEVRTAMVVFDETIYRIVPQLYRRVDGLLPGSRDARPPELRPPVVPAFLQFGSWIGGDRDGHPAVTAAVTETAARIHADHVLHGHEAVATRLAQTIAAKIRGPRVPSALVSRLRSDARTLPDLARALDARFPDEPIRQRFAFIAERLRRTRERLTLGGAVPYAGGYPNAAALLDELGELQEALVEVGLARSAWGEVQDFVWQVETFGFHLASLEIRQHADVHRRALATSGADAQLRTEVIDTIRALDRIQRDHGPAAASHYVVSFTSSERDVIDVLTLAEQALDGNEPAIDVVPLFESSDALRSAGAIVGALFEDPRYRAHLRGRGDRQEVMLGYSDSNKESGYVAANWLLHRAQAAIAEAGRRAGIEITLFHGRGGAIGRGGGELELAVSAQPPGSVDGRLKVTEQGEVVWTRYGDPELGLEHLEALTSAAIDSIARPAGGAHTAEPDGGPEALEELATEARFVYRALVYDDPGFSGFFARLTPIDEIARLQLGSRPASRSARRAIDDLRAIPWVFSWSQARIELPGWYGLGGALEAFEAAHPESGTSVLAGLYRDWPFFRSLIDHARLAVQRADLPLARGYAALAGEPGDVERWGRIEAEFERTVRALERLPDAPSAAWSGPRPGSPTSPGSAGLRAPYVDTLSVVQLELLRAMREREARDPEDPTLPVLRSLIGLTISGLSAALQGTG
jgi:phosphoenolpyruvate carboxylase